jgi:uncharacterized protein (TIGR03067 family)
MTDLDKLQGAWHLASLEVNGSTMPAPPDARIIINGSRFQSLGMGAVYEGTVEVDARKRPKTIDMVFTAGPEKGNRSLGIYDLDGGQLKLCLTVTGSVRPKAFATAPGSGLALETLTRAAGESGLSATESDAESPAGSPTSSAANDAAPEIEGEWAMTACIADGYPVPESMVKTGRRIARNGQTESYFGAQRLMQARYTVDRGVVPHTIDYTHKNGQKQFGIWRFEGEILHICFAQPGKERPESFEPSKGRGHTLTSWKLAGTGPS